MGVPDGCGLHAGRRDCGDGEGEWHQKEGQNYPIEEKMPAVIWGNGK